MIQTFYKLLLLGAWVGVFQTMPRSADAMPSLNPDTVLGFEVLVAGSCKTHFSCDYGHSFLRIVPADSEAPDRILGFGTDAASPNGLVQNIQFTVQGIFGLPLYQSFAPASAVYYNYVVRQKRELVRVPLQVTPRVKAKILENIETLIAAEETRGSNRGRYDILFNNCAGKIIELLNRSGVPRELFGIAIPLNLPAHFFRTYVALYPPLQVDPRSVLSMHALPAEFYRYCEDLDCAKSIRQKYDEIWPNQSIQFPKDENFDNEMRRTLATRTSPNHWSGQREIVMRHFRLLREVE